MDNPRTHEQSNVEAPWREEGKLRESFQKGKEHGTPVVWEGRRKQVPRIRQGKETRDPSCLIEQAQDPRNQVEAGTLIWRQKSYRQPAHRHWMRRGPDTTTYP